MSNTIELHDLIEFGPNAKAALIYILSRKLKLNYELCHFESKSKTADEAKLIIEYNYWV